MPLVATLDTNVLYPMPLADTLLRLADRGLFQPVWSDVILAELERTMIRLGRTVEQAHYRRSRMESAFPASCRRFVFMLASVPVQVQQQDRHVVAVAMASRSEVIVTDNLRHFAVAELLALGIEVQDAETFLIHWLGQDQESVIQVLGEQAAGLRDPTGIKALLGAFPSMPRFSDAVRRLNAELE